MLVSNIPDILGYIAGAIGICSFLLASKKHLLLARVATDVLFAAHYYLILAIPGAYLSLVYVTAVLLALAQKRLTRLQVGIIRLVICIIAAMIIYQTYEGLQDILILIATWISFSMYGVRCNVRMRWIALLVVNPLWLVYAIASGSIPAVLTLLAYEVTTVIGLYRARKIVV